MIRVLLVDDDALVRSGLRMMLAGAQSLEVVGEAADGREVLGAVDRHRPTSSARSSWCTRATACSPPRSRGG